MLSVAGSRTIWIGLLAVAVVAGVASAGTVDINSNGGSGTNNQGGTNVSLSGTVSPVWAPGGTDFGWISYGSTGCYNFNFATNRCTSGEQDPAGTTVDGAPTATFYQTFTITDASDSGSVSVWADDTATVYIDSGTVTSGDGSAGGTLEWLANGNVGPNCADAPIGCLTSTVGTFNLNLTSGIYTMVIDAYQLQGGTPFGVMYNGELGPPSVPEPASFLLMGLGLAGLGTLIRRRNRA